MAGPASFADNYKLGGLTPTPEIVGLRKPAFDRLLKEMAPAQTLELIRLYYGLPTAEELEWFRAAFAEPDESFTLVENEREVRILAACLLSAAVDHGDVGAILGVIAGAAADQRTPVVLVGLLSAARHAADACAMTMREARLVKTPFTQKAKGAYTTDADALVAAPDWSKAGELMKSLGDDAFEGTQHALVQVNTAIPPLVTAVEALQEQVNMLWWLIGGYSRVLGVPFTTLVPGVAGVMAGFDAARLSARSIGPIATAALVERLLGARRDLETSIEDTVDSFPRGEFEALQLGAQLGRVGDLCPVLGALHRAHEVGPSPSWVEPYKATTNLDPITPLRAKALAMQAYIEALFLDWLG